MSARLSQRGRIALAPWRERACCEARCWDSLASSVSSTTFIRLTPVLRGLKRCDRAGCAAGAGNFPRVTPGKTGAGGAVGRDGAGKAEKLGKMGWLAC